MTLEITKDGQGWAYSWRLDCGYPVLCGWSVGTKARALSQAQAHYRRARITPGVVLP